MSGTEFVHTVLKPWLGVGLLALCACSTARSSGDSAVVQPTPAVQTSTTTDHAQAVAAQVQALATRALQEEPKVTPVLINLAEQAGGEMIKLKYRLKTQASATRKLNKHLLKHPDKEASQVDLQDMLRYTMRINDQPAGNYVKSVHLILETLEAQGHSVELVKNCWPRGDSYSGVNTVLRAKSGLAWELQFHTSDSLRVQAETREMYEELRKVNTRLPRKRALFKQMAAAWDTVPVPFEVLEEKNLHAQERARRYNPPGADL